jgi:prolyl-tRNA synthetase
MMLVSYCHEIFDYVILMLRLLFHAGLVLPPQISPVQVVLIPLANASTTEADIAAIKNTLADYVRQLSAMGVRCEIDDRDSNHIRPGAKYYEWERKGVPLRVVLGGKELREGSVSVKTRISTNPAEGYADTKKATAVTVPQDELVCHVQKELRLVQQTLFKHASDRLASNTSYHSSYASLLSAVRTVEGIHKDNTTDNTVRESVDADEEVGDHDVTSGLGFYLAPWCPNSSNEQLIKAESKLTIRCYPDAKNFAEGAVWSDHREVYEQIKRGEVKCFFSDNDETATELALFARNF